MFGSTPARTARTREASADAAVTVAYLGGLAAAEITLVAAGPVPGALAYATLLLGLATHATMLPVAPYQAMLAAIAVAPVIRLLSLIVPFATLPPLVVIALVGGISLVGLAVAARVIAAPMSVIGLSRPDWGLQGIIAAAGLPVGLVMWVAIRPAALVGELSLATAVLGLAVLVVYVATVEGIAFRGLVQAMARERFGSTAAIAIGAGVPSIMLLSVLNPLAIALLTGLNVLLSWTAERSRSTIGVIGAHGLALFGMLILWPLTLG